MALEKCKECGHNIAKTATACPSCGAKIKRTSFVTKLVALFIGVGVIGVVVSSWEASNKKEEKQKAEAARVAALTQEQRKAEADAAAAKKAERDAREKKSNAAFAKAQAMAAAIRQSANDVKSIEFIDAAYTDAGAVYLVFTGKNAFNATIKNYAVMSPDGKTFVGSESKTADAINKYIAKRDIYQLPKP